MAGRQWTQRQQDDLLTLERVPAGEVVSIVELDNDADDDCRLREFGVFEGTTVEVVSSGDPVILSVFGNRFAICRRCAAGVLVRRVAVLV